MLVELGSQHLEISPDEVEAGRAERGAERVGAVVVLVLFAVMLTRAPIGRSGDHDAPIMTRMAALVIAAATGGLLFSAFVSAFGTRRARIDSGTTTDLAQNLFGRFAWPFEVVSLVLLSALVGALAMIGSRRSGGGR